MTSITLAALIPVLSLLANTATATSSLLISNNAPYIDTPQCLQSAYYGTYGGSSGAQDHIFLPSEDCLADGETLSSFNSGSIVPLEHVPTREGERLIWVGHAGVAHQGDMPPRIMEDSWSHISTRSKDAITLSTGSEDSQRVLDTGNEVAHQHPITLVHQSSNSLLLSVPPSFLPIIDTLLPSYLVPVALPSSPLPVFSTGWNSVPDKLAKHLADINDNLEFSPDLDKILSDGISLNEIRRSVRWLTGEAPSGIESRHSFTPGAVKAAKWIKSNVEETGATCTLQTFLQGFSPNVICHYPSFSNSTEQVIFSAHYDSRGSFGSTRAPGGDDDGSGSGHLLSLAYAIGSQGIHFDKSVTLAWFAGEEQGLLGSHAYAEYLHSENATVLLQVQADMLAYHAPGEPLQLGLPESIHLPEASYLIGNLSQLYSPELVVGKTAACCSDHQSFVSYGFPATQVFERNGPIVDPMYHNSGDLTQREGYDFEQVVSIAKVTLAALLTVAGYAVIE